MVDVGNDIDWNIYGSYFIYYDIRYFIIDELGKLIYVFYVDDKMVRYILYIYGVYFCNVYL